VPADDGAEPKLDYLHLVALAEQQAGSYVQQVNRKSWTRNYRAFHNQHFADSKYLHKDWARRSKIFVPKTRSAVRKDGAAVAASLFGTVDAISCSPGNEADPRQRAAAAVMQELINYRTDRTSGRNAIPWFLTAMGARQDAMLAGLCVSKQCWRLDLRKAAPEPVTAVNPASGRDEPVLEFDPETGDYAPQMRDVFVPDVDRPDVILFPPECVIIDPAADWTNPAQSAAYLILKYPMRLDEIERRADDPRNPWIRLKPEALRAAATATKFDAAAIRRAREFGLDRLDDTQNAEEFEVIWVYEAFIRHGGEDVTFYALGSKDYLTEPKPVRDVYPEQGGDRPVVVGYGALESHRIYPMSAVESWQQTQAEINDVRNLLLDTMKQNVAPVTKVVRGRNVDLDALHRRGPNSHVLMSRLDDIEFAQAPDVPQSAILGLEHLNADLDDLAGQFNAGSVQTNRMLNETVGGLQLIAGTANAVQEFDIRLWIETWAEPVMAQVVRLEQFYESNVTLLGLVGERAQLAEKFGIDRLDDELLEAQITIRINAGLGAGDPQQRLLKFQSAIAVAGPLIGQSREFQSGAMSVDVVAMLDEVFGAAGYRDGGKRFFRQNPPPSPPPPPPQAALMLQKLLADIEKAKAQADHARLTGIAAVKRADAADKRVTLGALKDGMPVLDPHSALRADPGSSPGQALPLSGGGMEQAALQPRGASDGDGPRSSLPLQGGGIGWGSDALPPGMTQGGPPGTVPLGLGTDSAANAARLPLPIGERVGVRGQEPAENLGLPQAPPPGVQIQRSPDGLATGMSLPPPQANPQALAALMQLLAGQLPAQREVELLRERGRLAGARVTEPDGRVRHFAFQRGANDRIVAAHAMDDVAPPNGIPQAAPSPSQGLQPGPMPQPMPPMPQAVPPMPRGGVPNGDPGLMGARRARDGHLYAPDPTRPGKFVMLRPRAAMPAGMTHARV
jgi:hypothetical protein